MIFPRSHHKQADSRSGSRSPELVSANVKRRRLPAKVKRFGRRLDMSWLVMFPRRRPAIALWILVFGFLAVQLQVWEGMPEGPEFVLTEGNRCVQQAARSAVRRSLAVVGHGVKVSRVDVGPVERWVAASYWQGSAVVRFSADSFPEADELLHTAAHESVHAIFDQANLNPFSNDPAWDSRMLAEEVAAEVLGAHIAGRVRTQQGRDGSEFTRRLIQHYRNQCDSSNPQGIRSTLRRYASAFGVDNLDFEIVRSIILHYGPVEMVDEMDRICREHPDPWEAAHVIADRFIEPGGE